MAMPTVSLTRNVKRAFFIPNRLRSTHNDTTKKSKPTLAVANN